MQSIRQPRSAWMAAVLALSSLCAFVALLTACGDDDDLAETAAPGDTTAYSTLTYPPGEIRPGHPNSLATGDFNGDGHTDLIVGAPYSTPDSTRNEAGRAYILLGPISGNIAIAAEADAEILGAASNDNLGAAVAAGDLNGDGIDDIVVGAPNSNALDNLRTDMGEAYIIFGRSDLSGTIDTLNEDQDATVQPAEGFSQLGRSFAIGDVNGDGIGDLVAGAPYAGREPGTAPGAPRTTVGEVYVIYGSPDLGGMITVMSDEQDVLLSGVRSYDQFGASVAVGDVDLDGTEDIIVGSPGYTGADGDRAAAGAVFVFSGGENISARVTSDDADRTYVGAGDDSLGTLVSFAMAGAPAIIASAPTAPTQTAAGVGRVYVINPESTAGSDVSDCHCALTISGSEPGSFFPTAMTVGAGGILIVSSISADGSRPGRVYTVGAGLTEDIQIDSGELALTEGATPSFGSALGFADLDGDGSFGPLVQAPDAAAPVMSAFDFEVTITTPAP